MLIVVVAWLYVALMMAIAEAFHPNGGVLGAIITFVMYGLAPVALVSYLLGTPARRKARRAAEAAEAAEIMDATAAATVTASVAVAQPETTARRSDQADARQHAAADTVAPMRKEP
jgi:mannose/fructose/N-acetylgalactosamine-specific phosphotransferase system component IID